MGSSTIPRQDPLFLFFLIQSRILQFGSNMYHVLNLCRSGSSSEVIKLKQRVKKISDKTKVILKFSSCEIDHVLDALCQ